VRTNEEIFEKVSRESFSGKFLVKSFSGKLSGKLSRETFWRKLSGETFSETFSGNFLGETFFEPDATLNISKAGILNIDSYYRHPDAGVHLYLSSCGELYENTLHFVP